MSIVRRRISLSALATALVVASLIAPRAFAQDAKPGGDKPAATPVTAAGPTATKPDQKPAEKFQLVYKAQKGQVRRSKASYSLTATLAGEKTVLESFDTVKRTFTDVAANGDITYEDVTEESKRTIDGEAMDDDEKKTTDTYTMRPNGALVKYKSSETETDADKSHLDERFFTATTPRFPDKPVGVGDKWTLEYPSDDTLGLRKATGKYEVVGIEKVGNNEAVRLKMEYSEEGQGAIAVKSVFVLEKTTGDVLSAEYNIEAMPFGPANNPILASGTSKETRVEGGPLAGSQNAVIANAGPDKPKEKTIDDTVKGLEKIPGLFTLYRKQESGKDTLYLEIREDQFEKLLLLQATASTGNAEQLIAGDPISDTIFKWTKQDDKVILTVPNWQWRTDPNTPLGRAAKRSFPDAYLMSFKVEAKQPDRKSVLIDVSDFFRSDFAQITLALMGGGMPTLGSPMSGGGYGMDREKTYIKTVKNFPDNTFIQTQYHFLRGGRPVAGSPQADSRSLPLLVNYNLFPLPNDPVTFAPTNGYRPRTADPRVGYFTAEYTDLRDDSKEDQTVRYILRWDLRKKDPKAALSEPVKPIVFWLDNAIPEEYRASVRKGLLSWNKAFEAVGIKNAIVVHQMPDNADWDHADMRYNVVRWAITPDGASRNGVAIALFRENPLTGQILNASITVDAAWTRFGKLERRQLIDPAVAYARASGLETDLLFNSGVPLSAEMQERISQVKSQFLRRAHGDPRYCDVADAMAMNTYLGSAAVRFLAPAGVAAVREKEYVDQMITEVVAHEFGHILGLRHNFVGSTGLTLDQLKDPNIVRAQGTTASVMDYNAFNISAIRAKGVDFFSQTIGSYDFWAIQYGYEAFAPSDEPAKLKAIASKDNEPGHAYHSDEAAFVNLDPRIVRGDISADPLAYWEKVINLSRYLLMNLDKSEPKQGESYYEFTKAFQMLLANYAGAAGEASMYVGGYTLNRNHRGDANEQPVTEPIDPARQKQALALLNTYIFAPDAFAFPERYYTHLTTDPNGFSFSADFPIADQVAGIQRAAMSRMFSAAVLRRIANSEFKKGGDPNRSLTLPVLFNSITGNVWAELGTKKNIPVLRRQLQRVWIDTMIDLATKGNGAPDDARMLAWTALRQIRTRLATTGTGAGLDEYTRDHIADSLTKVDRVLKASYTLGGNSGGGAPNLLQLLLGGQEP